MVRPPSLPKCLSVFSLDESSSPCNSSAGKGCRHLQQLPELLTGFCCGFLPWALWASWLEVPGLGSIPHLKLSDEGLQQPLALPNLQLRAQAGTMCASEAGRLPDPQATRLDRRLLRSDVAGSDRRGD